jgi:predicted nucleotidyltransferase
MFAVKVFVRLTVAGETVYKPLTTMQNELDVIRDVTHKFRTAGIEYMLTGAVAMTYYARPRMTQDIDLVVALEANDIDRVTALFETDYYVDRKAVSRAIANTSLFNVIHNQALIKVDCIVRKGTKYRLLEFERRREVSLQDIKVWIVSKEDLIISKLYWARDSHSEFQLRDVRNLLTSGYDSAYLAEWARKLGVHDLLEECLSE